MDEESIFASALGLASPDERNAYLDQACGNRPALRQQVELLLRASADAGSFIKCPALGISHTQGEGDSETAGDASTSAEDVCALLEPCETPGRIGKLGAYEIMEVVGSGGMGTVLRAFDVKLRRVVAVKVLSPQLAASGLAVKRFLREAQSAAAVHHDHVVTVHAVEDQSRPPFLVMEFVQGRTLQQKIEQEGELELKQILRIGAQIAAGLAAAHRQGLIHRDVKPANILLENGVERVKITDFGLARAVDDAAMTGTGVIAGTPQYMSPEQAQGGTVDFRSDLFSLGSVLYTMCAGRPAFRGETAMAVLRRVCDETPAPLAGVNPQIPEWLAAIVMRLLHKDPAARFTSADEVAALLEGCLAHVQNSTQNPLPQQVAQWQEGMEEAPRAVAWPTVVIVALILLLPMVALMAMGSEGRSWLLGRRSPPQSDVVAPVRKSESKQPLANGPSPAWLPPRRLGSAINTDGSEGGVSLSADGLTLLFHRKLAGQRQFDLCASTRVASGAEWTQAESLTGLVNTPEHSERFPQLLADQQTLWFESDRPGGRGGADLWMAHRATKESPWEAPRQPPGDVNSEENEEGPTLTSDGRLLVFFSKRPGGQGGSDLWMASRASENAPFAAPVNLGSNVNSPDDERTPWISPDGLLLLFCSARPGGFGLGDLWMSTRNSQGEAFRPAVNLGPSVNTSTFESRGCLSSDGMTLYFERPVGAGAWDIWEQRRAKTPLYRASDARQEGAMSRATRVASGQRATWSPDGEKLVYAVNPSGLRLLHLKTGQVEVLTDNGGDPAYSPTDERIAYHRGANPNYEVWLMDSDGKNDRLVGRGNFPTWSADGKVLYFHSPAGSMVRAADLSSSEPQIRDVISVPAFYPAVSPDGQWVAYVELDRLVVRDVKTGGKRQHLFGTGNGGLVSWSPDSRRVGFGGYGQGDTRGMWVFDLDSGQATQIATGPRTLPAWSPDGKRLAFDLRERSKEAGIWVTEWAGALPHADPAK